MPDVTYEIVQHDDGWAHRVNGVFSETFSTHDEALAAARAASEEQEIPGRTETIEYEDDKGAWHTKRPADETARTRLSRTWIERFEFGAQKKSDCYSFSSRQRWPRAVLP